MSKKVLMRGNEACVEGALAAGCRFYAGYPITPQNELIGYMSRRMLEEGGCFIQAESELAAINMVFGASVTGCRAMTSSSSPGVSLKQEGISYMAGCRLPAVIVNVARGGPGLGNIAPSQADYFQAVKGGGHGDYRCIVLAPNSVQEMMDLTYLAFELADKYRMPVYLLSDGMIGQMMESVTVKLKRVDPRTIETSKDWVLNGCWGRRPRSIKSLFLKVEELEGLNLTLQSVYAEAAREEVRYELYGDESPELLIVAYGLAGRVSKAVVNRLRLKGYSSGLIRPITLWPFPDEAIRRIAGDRADVLVVEMSSGQMVEDVRLALCDNSRVSFYGKMGGALPDEDEITDTAERILSAANRDGQT